MRFILGTRGSQLSLAQTRWVISELQKKNPEDEFEIMTIKTKGDTDARPLFTIDQKGIFEKEIDKAVSDGQIDFAVHSLKDVPSVLMENLSLGCVPAREAVNDIFIAKNGMTINEIPAGSTVGTSSLRRAVQISRMRNDLDVRPIRGNIETRIKKVQDGQFGAIVLAQAGINRIGISVPHSKLPIDSFPPSPGQGAIGIVCRTDDSKTRSMLQRIEHHDTRVAIDAERTLSEFVDSGCRFPVGAYGQVRGDSVYLEAFAYSIGGDRMIRVEKSGPRSRPRDVGKAVADDLVQNGVQDLAANWREKLEEWNK